MDRKRVERRSSEYLLTKLEKEKAILNEVTRILQRVKCTHEKNKFSCTICNGNQSSNNYLNLREEIKNNCMDCDRCMDCGDVKNVKS